MSDQEKKELTDELEELERREFLIQMDDHWSTAEYAESRRLNERIREIKRKIQEAEQ